MKTFIDSTVYLIVRIFNSKRLRWTGHLARMAKDMNSFKIITGKSTRKRPEEGLAVDERTMFEYILNK